MDEAHKELVKRLQRIQVGMANEEEDAVLAAIAALEAMAGEVEKVTKERDVSWAERKIWITGFNEQEVRAEAAEAERDRLKAALQPFARFAKMFAEAREHRRGHVPVEPNAEWYARETKQGTYILTPGMFDEALSALGDAL